MYVSSAVRFLFPLSHPSFRPPPFSLTGWGLGNWKEEEKEEKKKKERKKERKEEKKAASETARLA